MKSARFRIEKAAAGEFIDLGGSLAPLVTRIDRRARRLIVRVDALHGRVVVTAPSRRALKEALKFAQDRAAWIRARLALGEKSKPFAAGGDCPYEGVAHLIVHDARARPPVQRITEPAPIIVVGGEPAHLNRRLTDWLKKEARRAIEAAVARHAGALGKKPTRLQIRDTRTRWGSCSGAGALSFSWRLILTPPEMLDYVAAHECAHLVHLDHSPAFWRTVAELGADAGAAREWFAAHGEALHAWGNLLPPPLKRGGRGGSP